MLNFTHIRATTRNRVNDLLTVRANDQQPSLSLPCERRIRTKREKERRNGGCNSTLRLLPDIHPYEIRNTRDSTFLETRGNRLDRNQRTKHLRARVIFGYPNCLNYSIINVTLAHNGVPS